MTQIVLECNGSDQQVFPVAALTAAGLLAIVADLAIQKDVPISEINLRFAEADAADESTASPSLRNTIAPGKQSTL